MTWLTVTLKSTKQNAKWAAFFRIWKCTAMDPSKSIVRYKSAFCQRQRLLEVLSSQIHFLQPDRNYLKAYQNYIIFWSRLCRFSFGWAKKLFEERLILPPPGVTMQRNPYSWAKSHDYCYTLTEDDFTFIECLLRLVNDQSRKRKLKCTFWQNRRLILIKIKLSFKNEGDLQVPHSARLFFFKFSLNYLPDYCDTSGFCYCWL